MLENLGFGGWLQRFACPVCHNTAVAYPVDRQATLNYQAEMDSLRAEAVKGDFMSSGRVMPANAKTEVHQSESGLWADLVWWCEKRMAWVYHSTMAWPDWVAIR